jgi:hypothetical protein
MYRATKIVATLGPASSDAGVLERMVRAGVDVVRLNFSHGTTDDHLSRAGLVKQPGGRLADVLDHHHHDLAHSPRAMPVSTGSCSSRCFPTRDAAVSRTNASSTTSA